MTTAIKIEKTDGRMKILQRVMNLRNRAEDAGSSEAEMHTAFTMAMKLMDSYGIEEAELAIAEASGEIKLDVITKEASTSLRKGKSQLHKVLNCLNAIAEFTETRAVYTKHTGAATFTGHRPDIELADFLVAVIKEAMDREYHNYRARMGTVGNGAKNSFQTAMTYRVSGRLREMAEERVRERQTNKIKAERLKIENAATSTSTAIMVSDIAEQKAKEVESEFKMAHPRLRTVRTVSRSTNSTAHGAGYTAGDRVNLGRAITQGSTKSLA
jgi:hypothetical protein